MLLALTRGSVGLLRENTSEHISIFYTCLLYVCVFVYMHI